VSKNDNCHCAGTIKVAVKVMGRNAREGKRWGDQTQKVLAWRMYVRACASGLLNQLTFPQLQQVRTGLKYGKGFGNCCSRFFYRPNRPIMLPSQEHQSTGESKFSKLYNKSTKF